MGCIRFVERNGTPTRRRGRATVAGLGAAAVLAACVAQAQGSLRCSEDWNCNTCGGSSVGCTSCYNRDWQNYVAGDHRECAYCPERYGAVLFHGFCFHPCPSGMVFFEGFCYGCPAGYYVSSTTSCDSCHSDCETCFGPGADQCTSCAEGVSGCSSQPLPSHLPSLPSPSPSPSAIPMSGSDPSSSPVPTPDPTPLPSVAPSVSPAAVPTVSPSHRYDEDEDEEDGDEDEDEGGGDGRSRGPPISQQEMLRTIGTLATIFGIFIGVILVIRLTIYIYHRFRRPAGPDAPGPSPLARLMAGSSLRRPSRVLDVSDDHVGGALRESPGAAPPQRRLRAPGRSPYLYSLEEPRRDTSRWMGLFSSATAHSNVRPSTLAAPAPPTPPATELVHPTPAPPPSSSAAASRPAPDDDASPDDCVICCEKEGTIRLVPCGHKCLCETCARSFFQHARTHRSAAKCPLCRTDIAGTIRPTS